MGTRRPGWFHTAVAETISTIRSPRPYIRHHQTPPACHRIDQALLERRLTFADHRRTPGLARHAPRRWFVQRGVQPQAGNHGDQGRTSLSSSIAAKLASPTPMMRRCGNQNAAWISTCLPQSVSFLCWRLPDFCSSQYRSEGARTVRNGSAQHRPAQGILRQQHEREPAQAARLDEVTMRGADRISIDATSLDPRSPSPFDGVIEADHHRVVVGDEGVDQQAEQAARQPAAGPCVAVEHTVIVGKLRDVPKTHDAQSRRDGASARDKDRAHNQDQHMPHVGAVNAPRKGCIRAASASGTSRPAAFGIHIPRIHVSGQDLTIAGPVRISYDITLDSITQDLTQRHIVPTMIYRLVEMAKVELRGRREI